MVEAKIDPEKKVLFLLMFLALIGAIYGTYAYFSAQSKSSEQQVTTGTMELTFDDNTNIVRNENISPIVESDILTKAAKKSFSIKNTGNLDINIKISLTSIEITENLKNQDFKWSLYENSTKIAEDSFDKIGNETSIDLKNNIELTVDEVKSYDLYIWIRESGEPQNELQNGILNAMITATSIQ